MRPTGSRARARGAARVRQLANRGLGTPLNQSDMGSTVLVFSLVAADGVRMLGGRFSDDEIGDLLHLWRYAGHVLGIEDALLCQDLAEARALLDLVELTQAPADDDSRSLLGALVSASFPYLPRAPARLSVPPKRILLRYLIGPDRADRAGLPASLLDPIVLSLMPTAFRVAAPVLAAVSIEHLATVSSVIARIAGALRTTASRPTGRSSRLASDVRGGS